MGQAQAQQHHTYQAQHQKKARQLAVDYPTGGQQAKAHHTANQKGYFCGGVGLHYAILRRLPNSSNATANNTNAAMETQYWVVKAL